MQKRTTKIIKKTGAIKQNRHICVYCNKRKVSTLMQPVPKMIGTHVQRYVCKAYCSVLLTKSIKEAANSLSQFAAL